MKVTFDGREFVAICSYDEREIPRRAGFEWNPTLKYWRTSKFSAVYRLKKYCDKSALKKLEAECRLVIDETALFKIRYPLGLSLQEHQVEAVQFALRRNYSYLALDPGLGKTPVACCILNVLKQPAIYICPAFLQTNVEEEFKRWSNWTPWVSRLSLGTSPPDVLVVPDSLLARPETAEVIRQFVRFWVMDKNKAPVLFVDEAHRFKEPGAKRTIALLEYAKHFGRVVFMSGTPTPNGRPKELYAIFSTFCPELIDFKDYWRFGLRYCGAVKTPFGWNFDGATNVSELHERIKPFYLRIRKSDIATKLPPKLEELVLVDGERPKAIIDNDERCLLVMKSDGSFRPPMDDEAFATYWKDLGRAKVKPGLQHVKAILEETDEAVIVFAHHIQVVKDIFAELLRYDPLSITAETKNDERMDIAKKFQEEPKHRVLVASIRAAGIGFTLTKASRVVFVETSPVPADNDQAADRAHRIGQTETVLVQYLVFKNSFERKRLAALMKKNSARAKL